MVFLQTLQLAHLPPDSAVHVALYEDLQNSRYLRKQLLDGNAEFEYAFIDARTVLSEAHVLAAVFRAVNDMSSSRMKSRNVHSEIVFALNPNNNIAESFRKFGISDQTRKLLVIKIAKVDQANAIKEQLETAVEAKPLEFNQTELSRLADIAEIKKIYKLNAMRSFKRGEDDGATAALDEIEAAVLGTIALRGAS